MRDESGGISLYSVNIYFEMARKYRVYRLLIQY